MQILTIKIKSEQALYAIRELEACSMIEIISDSLLEGFEKKRSERLSGSIIKAQADDLRKELDEMRSEWERIPDTKNAD